MIISRSQILRDMTGRLRARFSLCILFIIFKAFIISLSAALGLRGRIFFSLSCGM